jgi:hypothetical protein
LISGVYGMRGRRERWQRWRRRERNETRMIRHGLWQRTSYSRVAHISTHIHTLTHSHAHTCTRAHVHTNPQVRLVRIAPTRPHTLT